MNMLYGFRSYIISFFFYHCLSGLSPPQEGGAYALAS